MLDGTSIFGEAEGEGRGKSGRGWHVEFVTKRLVTQCVDTQVDEALLGLAHGVLVTDPLGVTLICCMRVRSGKHGTRR